MKYKVGCKYIYSKGCFDVYVHCIDEEGKRRVYSNLRTMTFNVASPGETNKDEQPVDEQAAALELNQDMQTGVFNVAEI